MADKQANLCMGCMSPNTDERCSVCGYDPQSPVDPHFLRPQSLITQRYLIGKLIGCDPEGAWYVGYDLHKNVRVWVREYAPPEISRRDYESGAVIPLTSAEAQYKALRSDFEDLCRTLSQLAPGEKILPVEDLVHANNTIYAVYPYIKTITLESFLERSGGSLSWRHTKKLLMPLFHTVSNAHRAGLIHRGLSPNTIHLDQTGALWMSSFSIAPARTNKSELSAQLFEGYAAPEQYALNGWQGVWTDVYALGAITYRVLTGKNPPNALDRVYGDDLLEPHSCSDMADNTVQAVNKALSVEVEDRTKTVDAYIADLLATEGSDTAVYTAPPRRILRESVEDNISDKEIHPIKINRPQLLDEERFEGRGRTLMATPSGARNLSKRQPRRAPDQRRRRKKHGHPGLSLFFSLLVATGLLGFGAYYIANNYLGDLLNPSEHQQNSSSAVQAGADFSQSPEDDGKLPRFVGITIDSVKNNAEMQGRYTFVIKEEHNVEYEKGVIYNQQPVEGTEVAEGGEVTLFVSKGIEIVEMPEIDGKPLEEAIALLEKAGVKYDIIPVYKSDYEPGIVNSTDTPAGTKLEKENDRVAIFTKNVEASSEKEEKDEKNDEESSSSKREKNPKKDEDSSKNSSSKRRKTVKIEKKDD